MIAARQLWTYFCVSSALSYLLRTRRQIVRAYNGASSAATGSWMTLRTSPPINAEARRGESGLRGEKEMPQSSLSSCSHPQGTSP
ncbi:hypothetical protein LZ30DRAFT_42303 [Colletotrichum cereale]|nr:hypothetical protein LZ30DRAFT_42303 [Colletotrichum cereale]